MWQFLLGKTMTKTQLQINSEKCLRYRYKDHKCQICYNNCPSDAIQILDNKIEYNEKKCQNCGICCHQCPTEVFHLDSELLKNYEEKIVSKEVVCFTCQRQDDGEVDIMLPCLKSLSPEIVMLAALKEVPMQMYWEEEHCHKCNRSWDYEKTLAWIEDWNKQFDKIYKIDIIHDKKLKLGRNRSVSRRDFFMVSKKQLKQKIGSLVFDSYSEIKLKEKIPLTGKRTCLSNFSKYGKNIDIKLTPSLLSELRLSNRHVNDGCSLCSKCVALCPTGALKINSIENNRSLTLNRLECIDCGLCSQNCSYIEREDFTEQLEQLKNTIELSKAEQAICSKCGDPVSKGKMLCLDCELDKQKKEELLASW